MTKTKVEPIKFSTRGSFEGWTFFKWFKGNWKTIKEIVKVGAPLLLSMAVFKDNPALIATMTFIGKLIIDSLEYKLTEVKL